jgi:protein involved in polysaccharide export with SLBB domain
MRLLTVLLLVAGAMMGAQPVLAQEDENWDPRQVYMSRNELQSLLDRFEGAAASTAYSDFLRAEARAEAALIEVRVDEGDFQVGDRILLRVQGEPTLSDTFTVGDDRLMDLPDIGGVPLDGVLRAELEDYLSEYLGRYVREPRVQARALIPVTIVGGVLRPGFYTVPSQLQLSDVLMVAGGPTPLANLDRLRIERGGTSIWEGAAIQDAIVEGRTLDQMNVRGGDRIQLPARGANLGAWESSVRTFALLLTIPATVVALIAIF